jgi:hypothetical protein
MGIHTHTHTHLNKLRAAQLVNEINLCEEPPPHVGLDAAQSVLLAALAHLVEDLVAPHLGHLRGVQGAGRGPQLLLVAANQRREGIQEVDLSLRV